MALNIGVIGVGNIGGELVRKFRIFGHKVRIANSRGPESLTDLAAETGAIASTTEEVILNSEVIMVSVPQKVIPSLAKDFAQHKLPEQVVLVDTGNYYRHRDGDIADIDNGLTDSAWVAQQLSHPVMKVFNNIGAPSLKQKARPAGHPERFALPVAADSPAHKNIVLQLVESIGFDAVDAGSIADSWRQQPGTAAAGTDYDKDALRDALQRAVRNELRKRIDVFISRVVKRDPALTLEQGVQWFRDQAEEPYESVLQAHQLLEVKK